MLEPIDIAIEVHKICEEILIPKGISPQHDINAHSITTKIYAEKINGTGVHFTGKRVVAAILEASGWNLEGPWPGHPSPEKVIEVLLNGDKDNTTS